MAIRIYVAIQNDTYKGNTYKGKNVVEISLFISTHTKHTKTIRHYISCLICHLGRRQVEICNTEICKNGIFVLVHM